MEGLNGPGSPTQHACLQTCMDPAAGINKRFLKSAEQVAGLELQPKRGVREFEKGGGGTLFLEEFLCSPSNIFRLLSKSRMMRSADRVHSRRKRDVNKSLLGTFERSKQASCLRRAERS